MESVKIYLAMKSIRNIPIPRVLDNESIKIVHHQTIKSTQTIRLLIYKQYVSLVFVCFVWPLPPSVFLSPDEFTPSLPRNPRHIEGETLIAGQKLGDKLVLKNRCCDVFN